MKPFRSASEKEKLLIRAMLERKPQTRDLVSSLNDLVVQDMEDGRMGSLTLVPKDSHSTLRQFGTRLVLAEFTDSDGVPVSVSINLDKDGRLYELDMWKVDFSPLVQLPEPSAIKIIS